MSDKQWFFMAIVLWAVFGYVVPYIQYKNFNPPKPSKDVRRPIPRPK